MCQAGTAVVQPSFMATCLGQVGARGAAAAGDAEPVAVRAAVEAGAGCVCCAAAAWAVAEDERARQVANVAVVVVAGVELRVGVAGGCALVRWSSQ